MSSVVEPPIEFEVAGRRYRAYKLSAFDQGHIARRIAPLIPTLLPIFLQIARSVRESEKGRNFTDSINALLSDPAVLQPFTDALSDLDDDKFEYVITKCMSAVRGTRNDKDWVPVWNAASGRAMFAELNELSALLPVAIYVIKDSLGNFIQGLLASSGAAAGQQPESGASSPTATAS